MKLHSDPQSSLRTVTAYGPGYIEVNRERFEGAVLVRPDVEVMPWRATSFGAITQADFDALLALGPEVVILGTGERQRFPHPGLWASLAAARVGLEAMDTRAACRTYNILMAEGRRVLAALLPL